MQRLRLHTSGMESAPGLASLIAELREHLSARRIGQGLAALDANQRVIATLDACHTHAAVLVGLIAQWVDIGYGNPELLRGLLDRFSKQSRIHLPLFDYLHLRIAEGLLSMTEEEFSQAIEHFQFVQSVEEEIRDTELSAVSNFWTARCLRQEGRYDDALTYTVTGKRLALDRGCPNMAAVMQVMESWLVFQKGRLKEAAAILREAEATLSHTDDFVARGNIQSAYGRIARRENRYDRALEHFERAVIEFKRRDPKHSNLARTLVNMAFVKRLVALQMHNAMDEEAARRRSGSSAEGTSEMSRARRSQVEQLRTEAKQHLAEALAIYAGHRNHRGIGSVHINRGYLTLDAGDLDSAAAEGGDAFAHGEEKRDYILMARARILQCMVENAKVEEQIDDSGRHAQFAQDYARDAVEYARQTQNRRLLARALVWQGLTHCNDRFADRDAARQCCDAAIALLRPNGMDYLWDDLETLKVRVRRPSQVDPMLQEWSAGLTGGRTFQQITESFAAIVIAKVWEREGRKISRVASELSISPKKVRRVLDAAGLLRDRERGARTHA